MKQCFAYIRVSTVKQGEGVSLEAQREAITGFASRHNLTITRWFEEKETAAKRGRSQFNNLVKELQRGRAGGLVIHKIDRSARNLADWARIGDLADAGIDIHFVTESLDFRSRGGRLAADVQAVVAADYVRNLREETIKGLTGRLKQGLYPFRAPIGYLDNGKGKAKTLDPLRAPLVKEAFELYGARQHSLRTLLVHLQQRGLTNRTGGKLSMCGLETMLNNAFYTGIIHIKRTGATYTGIHERLISPALFERVQNVKSGKSGPKVTKHKHTYQGLFRCGLCDAPMVPELQKGHVYYRCKTSGCNTKTVREERLTDAVRDFLQTVQLTEANFTEAINQIERWAAQPDDDGSKKTLALKAANLADRKNRLTDALIDGLIDREAHSERVKALAVEEEALRNERANRADHAADAANLRSLAELAKDLCLSHDLAFGQDKRGIVELASPNRKVIGKEVYLEPHDWLEVMKNDLGVFSGAPARDKDRTNSAVLSGVPEEEKLAELLKQFGQLETNDGSRKAA